VFKGGETCLSIQALWQFHRQVTQPVDKFLMTYEQILVFPEHFMGLHNAPVTQEKFSRGCSVCGQVQDFLLGRGRTVGGKDAGMCSWLVRRHQRCGSLQRRRGYKHVLLTAMDLQCIRASSYLIVRGADKLSPV
jgi:hypothetical protein